MVEKGKDTIFSTKERLKQIDIRFKKRQLVFTRILDSFQKGNVQNIFETIMKSACHYLCFNRAVLLEDSETGAEGIVLYEWCADETQSYYPPKLAFSYYPHFTGINEHLEQNDTYFLTPSSSLAFPALQTEDIFCVVVKIWLNSQRYGLFILDEREEPVLWDDDAIWFLSCIKSVLSIAASQNNSIIMSNKYTDQLYYMVFYDPLTHLPNRYRFDESATRTIITARKNNLAGYVIYIDLDEFKLINDSYGHKTGDLFLVEFSRFLQSTFDFEDSIYRLGGDEFALLINPEHASKIDDIIARISARVYLPWQVEEHLFYSTVSMAVVQCPTYGSTAEEVLKNADIALDIAKQSGRNCCVFYTKDLHQDPIHRLELEKELRDAISNGFRGFEPYFQPVVETSDGRVHSAEALARWHNATGKAISPADFIPLAEYLGLIVPIGEFMLEKAAALCKQINDMGMPDFCIGINVSMRQIRQPDFTEKVRKILDKTGVNYSNIILEVTESLAAAEMGMLSAAFQELRSYGIKIALDDFGTGYSSLSYLQQMPIDIIKIDRSFVSNITSDNYAHTFVHIIVDLGHSLGRRVCIEGVETQEQLDICKNANADCIQGYLFYSARTASELVAICQKELKNSHAKPNYSEEK